MRKYWLPAFPPFPAKFSTLSPAEIITLASFNLSSANALNLAHSVNLLFHKEYTKCLKLSKTTSFQLFKDNNFKNDENRGILFFKRVENTVGKGEIARYEQFLLFQQCFQKTCTEDM